MTKMTPPMHTKGLFKLKAPWPTELQAIYEVIAIRSFDDFIKKGESVYEQFYRPNSLDTTDYESDREVGAHIVTLRSDTATTIFVPDTYIQSYPAVDTITYSRIVLSVDLGPLPADVALDHLKVLLSDTASDVIGRPAVVKEHAVPYGAIVTEGEHATLESARQAAITNRTIDRARVVELQTLADGQAQHIADLEAAVIALQQELADLQQP